MSRLEGRGGGISTEMMQHTSLMLLTTAVLHRLVLWIALLGSFETLALDFEVKDERVGFCRWLIGCVRQ